MNASIASKIYCNIVAELLRPTQTPRVSAGRVVGWALFAFVLLPCLSEECADESVAAVRLCPRFQIGVNPELIARIKIRLSALLGGCETDSRCSAFQWLE